MWNTTCVEELIMLLCKLHILYLHAVPETVQCQSDAVCNAYQWRIQDLVEGGREFS